MCDVHLSRFAIEIQDSKKRTTIALDVRGKNWKVWGHQALDYTAPGLSRTASDSGITFLALYSQHRSQSVYSWEIPKIHARFALGGVKTRVEVRFQESLGCNKWVLMDCYQTYLHRK